MKTKALRKFDSLSHLALPIRFGLLIAFSLATSAAVAQAVDCKRLQAQMAEASGGPSPAAAAAARAQRVELDRASAYAHSIGCDNQQFLFFGKAPPPQCAGLKANIQSMRGRYEALQQRAGGDSSARRQLVARYNAACVPGAAPGQPPREKNFFETLFGGGSDDQQIHDDEMPVSPDQAPKAPGDEEGGNGKLGGSQAICVRSCDGGFFPLNFSARHSNLDQLTELCKALCPNTEVAVYTRNPAHDVSTALSVDGQPYEDLPNALKFTKSVEPNCGCKAPNQSWVEALAHAEEVLNQMGGASEKDTTVTEQQSQALSQPSAAATAANDKKQRGKAADDLAKAAAPQIPPTPGATVLKPIKSAPRYGAMDGETREMIGPDGATRRVRIVGPIF